MIQEFLSLVALVYIAFVIAMMVTLILRIGQYYALRLFKKTSDPDFSTWYVKHLKSTGRRA